MQARPKNALSTWKGVLLHGYSDGLKRSNQRNRFHHFFLLRTRERVKREENSTIEGAEEGDESAFSGTPDNNIRSSSCVTPSLSIIINAPLIMVFSKL